MILNKKKVPSIGRKNQAKKVKVTPPPTNAPKEYFENEGLVFKTGPLDHLFPELEDNPLFVQHVRPNIEKIYDWFAMEGLAQTEVAARLGISKITWYKFGTTCPRFRQFVYKAMSIPRLQVKMSMFQHAIGYYAYEESEEVVFDDQGNEIPSLKRVKRYKKWIPGSPTLQIFLSKLLYPEQFQETNVIGNILAAPQIIDDIPKGDDDEAD